MGKVVRPKYYTIWRSMIYRCYDPKCNSYKHYGGRGITVCDKWRNSREQFVEDMGEKPEGNYSIDRINNDGNYEPGNCRWATPLEQGRNRRKKPKPAEVCTPKQKKILTPEEIEAKKERARQYQRARYVSKRPLREAWKNFRQAQKEEKVGRDFRNFVNDKQNQLNSMLSRYNWDRDY